MNLKQRGMVKDIGVRNFSDEKFEKLSFLETKPVINYILGCPSLLGKKDNVGAHNPNSVPGWFGVSHNNLNNEVLKNMAKEHSTTTRSLLVSLNTS